MVNLSRGAVILLSLLLAPFTYATDSPALVINEVAWMGTESSYSNEWIELYNNTDLPLTLDGWVLKTADGTPEISLTGIIPAKGFYLLERTDDDTVPEVPANQLYKGSLNNNGENLELYDSLDILIDSLDCSSAWLAGDNTTKQTMERIDSGDWQTSLNPGGTPKAKNSIATQEEIGTAEAQPQQITYPSGIVINEILPSPEGPDAEKEWIEIFNRNDFEVDLVNWQIIDTVGTTRTYTFPKDTLIKPKGYSVLRRPTTKITLNNSGDGLKLIQPNGEVADFVEYGKAPRGESYNLVKSGWAWSNALTPNLANMILLLASEGEAEESASEEKAKKENNEDKGLAAISELFLGGQEKKTAKSPFLFLAALFIAIFSGIIILFLKKQLKINRSKNL